MKQRIYLLYMIIIIAVSGINTLSSQTYAAGVVEFGLVDLQMEGVDSAMIAMLRPAIEQKMETSTIYFNRDSVAIIEGDTRTVLDLSTNTCYKFSQTSSGVLQGFATYNDGLQTTYFQPETLGSDSTLTIVLDTLLQRSHLDLPARRYRISSSTEAGHMFIETTSSIQVPGIEFVGNGDHDFPLTIEMNNAAPGMSMTLGIKSVKEGIPDLSVFSIDTTGMVNMTGLAPALEEMLNDGNDKE
jgi:hypothetical protein